MIKNAVFTMGLTYNDEVFCYDDIGAYHSGTGLNGEKYKVYVNEEDGEIVTITEA